MFFDEVAERWDDYTASRQRIGVTREAGWLQATPHGDLLNLLIEGNDPITGNRQFAASRDPFDLWFKDRAARLTGVDFNEPIPVHPELVNEAVPAGQIGKQNMLLVTPLLPGMTASFLESSRELSGKRREGWEQFQRNAGVSENRWLQHTPMGDYVLLYLDGADLSKAFAYLATSTGETETWFRQVVLDQTGVDWAAPPPPLPEVQFDWRV